MKNSGVMKLDMWPFCPEYNKKMYPFLYQLRLTQQIEHPEMFSIC